MKAFYWTITIIGLMILGFVDMRIPLGISVIIYAQLALFEEIERKRNE